MRIFTILSQMDLLQLYKHKIMKFHYLGVQIYKSSSFKTIKNLIQDFRNSKIFNKFN